MAAVVATFLARDIPLPDGVALDASQRRRKRHVVGRNRAAGGAVQVADPGAPQFRV